MHALSLDIQVIVIYNIFKIVMFVHQFNRRVIANFNSTCTSGVINMIINYDICITLHAQVYRH